MNFETNFDMLRVYWIETNVILIFKQYKNVNNANIWSFEKPLLVLSNWSNLTNSTQTKKEGKPRMLLNVAFYDTGGGMYCLPLFFSRSVSGFCSVLINHYPPQKLVMNCILYTSLEINCQWHWFFIEFNGTCIWNYKSLYCSQSLLKLETQRVTMASNVTTTTTTVTTESNVDKPFLEEYRLELIVGSLAFLVTVVVFVMIACLCTRRRRVRQPGINGIWVFPFWFCK